MKLPIAAALACALAGATAAHAQPARDYVRMAAASDKFEIAEARLAEQRSHDPRVLQFARMMVRDHSSSTAQIKAAVRQTTGHDPAPAMLEPRQQRMLADLRHARGRAFDRAYLDQQTASHQEALDLHRGYADRGDAPELRRTAATITPVVQQHLAEARDLRTHLR